MKVFLVSILVIVLLSGCGSSPTASSSSYAESKPTSELATSTVAEESSEDAKDIKAEVASEQLYKYMDSLNSPNALYVAEIKNTGTVDLEIKNISIDLEDSSGKIMESANMVSPKPGTIKPGESAYICESLLSLGSKANLDDIGKVLLHYDVKESSNSKQLDVEISELSMEIEYNRPKIVGRVENKSDTEIKNLFIAIPIKDADGKLQTVCLAMIDVLAPKDKKGFDQMAMFVDINADFTNSTFTAIPYTMF